MTIGLGIIGLGTVGTGCVDILLKHREDFARHYGVDIEIAAVCSRESAEATARGIENLFTPDFHEVINNPSVDIVVELIGGTTAAYELVTTALKAGKPVVTANKALMATKGAELFELAAASGVEILFEASVGGGIPIIGPMKHELIANEIETVMGIVNGTTNYMLTRMAETGLSYEDALKEAQAAGYAEADPTADVEGFDAAAKIAILASIAFNSRVTLSDVATKGISDISPVDLKMAAVMGYAVKLLAIAQRTSEGIAVSVQPTMLPLSHQLAHVNGVFNAIYVVGDAVGSTMFFGEGAGAGPAASSVMGNVVDLARRMAAGADPIVGCTCTDNLPIVGEDNLTSRCYIRLLVPDRTGVLAAASTVFSNHGVSLRSVKQEGTHDHDAVDLIFVTHSAKLKAINLALEELAQVPDMLLAEPCVIHVEA